MLSQEGLQKKTGARCAGLAARWTRLDRIESRRTLLTLHTPKSASRRMRRGCGNGGEMAQVIGSGNGKEARVMQATRDMVYEGSRQHDDVL
jgi:hypothetical protein